MRDKNLFPEVSFVTSKKKTLNCLLRKYYHETHVVFDGASPLRRRTRLSFSFLWKHFHSHIYKSTTFNFYANTSKPSLRNKFKKSHFFRWNVCQHTSPCLSRCSSTTCLNQVERFLIITSLSVRNYCLALIRLTIKCSLIVVHFVRALNSFTWLISFESL